MAPLINLASSFHELWRETMHCNVISLTLCPPTYTHQCVVSRHRHLRSGGAGTVAQNFSSVHLQARGKIPELQKYAMMESQWAVGRVQTAQSMDILKTEECNGCGYRRLEPLCVHEDPSLKLIISEATTADVFQQADITISILSPY